MTSRVEWLTRDHAQPYETLYHECAGSLVQQSVQWADVLSASIPDTPYFGVLRDAMGAVVAGLPVYHFEGASGAILTSVPHAGPLGGILSRDDLGDEDRQQVYSALLDAALALARDLGCAALTVISHPFRPDSGLYVEARRPDYVLHNFCQVFRLDRMIRPDGTFDAGGRSRRRHFRRNLQKAEDAGVRVRWAEKGEFDVWYAVHRARILEKDGEPLPYEHLRQLLEVLEPLDKAGLAVATMDQRIIGGCIYVWNGFVVDAYILGTTAAWLDRGVNYALANFSTTHFASRGLVWYNWQSSADSGVHRTKFLMGATEMPYDFLTWTFPGFERILARPVQDIADEYALHYVVPFAAIDQGLPRGVFERSSAKSSS